MLSCWRVKPESRPLFNELEQTIVHLMGNGIGEHYVKLNETYSKQNLKPTSNPTDYFALLGCPDFLSPSVPKMILEHSQELGSKFNCDKIVSNFYASNSIQ